MMNNLKGIALEEKVMSFVVNSCSKVNKECNIDDLFSSEFLKDEKTMYLLRNDEHLMIYTFVMYLYFVYPLLQLLQYLDISV